MPSAAPGAAEANAGAGTRGGRLRLGRRFRARCRSRTATSTTTRSAGTGRPGPTAGRVSAVACSPTSAQVARAIISGNNFTNARAGGDGAVGNNSGDASGGGMFLESAGLTANSPSPTTRSAATAPAEPQAQAPTHGAASAPRSRRLSALTCTPQQQRSPATAPATPPPSTGGILSSNDSTTATTVKNTILSGNIANRRRRAICSSPAQLGWSQHRETRPPTSAASACRATSLGANPAARTGRGPTAARHSPSSSCRAAPRNQRRGQQRLSRHRSAWRPAPAGLLRHRRLRVRAAVRHHGRCHRRQDQRRQRSAARPTIPTVGGGSAHFEFGKTKSYGSQTGSQGRGPRLDGRGGSHRAPPSSSPAPPTTSASWSRTPTARA